jgi:hypothetical protein
MLSCKIEKDDQQIARGGYVRGKLGVFCAVNRGTGLYL